MKRYICLEENQITYVCGKLTLDGFKVEKADRQILSEKDTEPLIKEFAIRNNLNGKRVILALDSGVFFSALNVPNGKPKHLREMVCNELTSSIGKEQRLVVSATPFQKNQDGSVTVLAYAIPEKDFYRQLTLLKQAGIRCSRVYVLSNCMGQMAVKLFPDKRRIILVEPGMNQVRLLLIEDGYCILARTIRLNVRHFCETGAFGLLYDEITEQISKAIQFYKIRNKEDDMDTIVLASDVLPDLQEAAKIISNNLGLPCTVWQMNVEVPAGQDPAFVKSCHRALMVISKYKGKQSKEGDLLASERQEWMIRNRSERSRFWPRTALLLLASVLVLAVGGAVLKVQNYQNYHKIQVLREYTEDVKQQTDYYDSQELVDRIQEKLFYQNALMREAAAIHKQNRLDYSDFRVIREAMSTTMVLSGMHYDSASSLYEVDLLADSPKEFPEFVEAVRQSGQFVSVTYKHWQQIQLADQEYGYAITILAECKEGEGHEIE